MVLQSFCSVSNMSTHTFNPFRESATVPLLYAGSITCGGAAGGMFAGGDEKK